METNLWRTGGLWASQRVLLALTQTGMSREDAYAAVQTAAMNVWHNLPNTDLQAEMGRIEVIKTALTPSELGELFNLEYYRKSIQTAFSRVF
jgi:adenylosuccinate lyase